MPEEITEETLGEFAEVLCELASTDIQLAVEPYARLDWHTLRTVAGMIDKMIRGDAPSDIMNDWIEAYTVVEQAEGDADYEVQLLMPLSFDRGHNGLIKDAIWQKLGDSAMSTSGDSFGVSVTVPAGTSMHAVGSKAMMVLVSAAHEAGYPLTDLPFVEEIHKIE